MYQFLPSPYSSIYHRLKLSWTKAFIIVRAINIKLTFIIPWPSIYCLEYYTGFLHGLTNFILICLDTISADLKSLFPGERSSPSKHLH